MPGRVIEFLWYLSYTCLSLWNSVLEVERVHLLLCNFWYTDAKKKKKNEKKRNISYYSYLLVNIFDIVAVFPNYAIKVL